MTKRYRRVINGKPVKVPNGRRGFFGNPTHRKWGSEGRTNPVSREHIYKDRADPFTIPRRAEQEVRQLIGIRPDHNLVFFKSGEEFFVFVPRTQEKGETPENFGKFMDEKRQTPEGIYLQIIDPVTIGIVKEGLKRVKH